MREIVEPVLAGMRARGSRVSRIPLRRPDADLRRPQGDRVQRPVRRSRGAGRAAAASTAISRRCSRPPPTAPSTTRCARRSAGRSWSASCSRRRAIRAPGPTGCRSTGSTRRRQLEGVTVFHAGTARRATADRDRRRPGADRRRPRRRPSRRAIARAYEGVSHDLASTACSIAATSARKREAAASIEHRTRLRANQSDMSEISVLILMGSDSDAPVMQAAVDVLQRARHPVRDDRRLGAPLARARDAARARGAGPRRQGVHRRRRRRRAPGRRGRGAHDPAGDRRADRFVGARRGWTRCCRRCRCRRACRWRRCRSASRARPTPACSRRRSSASATRRSPNALDAYKKKLADKVEQAAARLQR